MYRRALPRCVNRKKIAGGSHRQLLVPSVKQTERSLGHRPACEGIGVMLGVQPQQGFALIVERNQRSHAAFESGAEHRSFASWRGEHQMIQSQRLRWRAPLDYLAQEKCGLGRSDQNLNLTLQQETQEEIRIEPSF